MLHPFRILAAKRAGERLSAEEIRAVAQGAADGSWTEGQLAAFLMAAAIRGLDLDETRALTIAMLESGERWELAKDVPDLADKHSTGGVGDKVSLVLAPLLASCGIPIAMLAGRGLGHTAGTIDKLEAIPGVEIGFDRARCLATLARCNFAIGGATGSIAPADKRLYAIRDTTATIDSLPLIVGSILSKKLALGAKAVVFDVKCGSGAFLPEPEGARELARQLVTTARSLGTAAGAILTDVSQPLGRFSGHAAEVNEAMAALAGDGPPDLMEVTYTLAEEAARLVGRPLPRQALEYAVASGRARERMLAWAGLQGADPTWLDRPELPLAPVLRPILASRSGVLVAIETRQVGLLLGEAGAGRQRPSDAIDHGVAHQSLVRLGEPCTEGQELARVYLRREDPELVQRFAACYTIGESGRAPQLILETL
jgi:pyrimidine-nucleoside phosphorylase